MIKTTYNNVIIKDINKDIISFYFDADGYDEQLIITYSREDVIDFEYSYSNASITIYYNPNNDIIVKKVSEVEDTNIYSMMED
jgi:hypothetical protein